MHSTIQFEDRVSRSRSKHEGEPSADLCDRLSRTRVQSQRQLPTDHDHAVPTREYQLDQSSPIPATAAADLVLELQPQKQPQRLQLLTGSHHIRSESSTTRPRLVQGATFHQPMALESAPPEECVGTTQAERRGQISGHCARQCCGVVRWSRSFALRAPRNYNNFRNKSCPE